MMVCRLCCSCPLDQQLSMVASYVIIWGKSAFGRIDSVDSQNAERPAAAAAPVAFDIPDVALQSLSSFCHGRHHQGYHGGVLNFLADNSWALLIRNGGFRRRTNVADLFCANAELPSISRKSQIARRSLSGDDNTRRRIAWITI